MGAFWIMLTNWSMGDIWIMGDFWTKGDLWIMVDFSMARGGGSTQLNKQTHTHIYNITRSGLGSGPSKNDTNTKHWNAEI